MERIQLRLLELLKLIIFDSHKTASIQICLRPQFVEYQSLMHLRLDKMQNMSKYGVVVLFFGLMPGLVAGQNWQTCKTKFIPHSVTYNASPKPNECWEAVASGILVDTEKVKGFFSLPGRVLDDLEKIIGNEEVIIEVRYFEKQLDSNKQIAAVQKIILKCEIIYDEN